MTLYIYDAYNMKDKDDYLLAYNLDYCNIRPFVGDVIVIRNELYNVIEVGIHYEDNSMYAFVKKYENKTVRKNVKDKGDFEYEKCFLEADNDYFGSCVSSDRNAFICH